MNLCKDCVFHEHSDLDGYICKSRMRLYPSVIDGETLVDHGSITSCLDRNLRGNCYDFQSSDGKVKQKFNPFKSLLWLYRWGYKRAGVQDESEE